MAFLAAGEAAGARAGAGAATRRAGAGRAAGKRSAGKSTAEQQREAIQAIKDARPAEPEPKPKPAEESDPKPVTVRMEPASSGAGVVLGVIVWAFAVNYIRGGMPQVKRFARAKFLNKTD